MQGRSFIFASVSWLTNISVNIGLCILDSTTTATLLECNLRCQYFFRSTFAAGKSWIDWGIDFGFYIFLNAIEYFWSWWIFIYHMILVLWSYTSIIIGLVFILQLFRAVCLPIGMYNNKIQNQAILENKYTKQLCSNQ